MLWLNNRSNSCSLIIHLCWPCVSAHCSFLGKFSFPNIIYMCKMVLTKDFKNCLCTFQENFLYITHFSLKLLVTLKSFNSERLLNFHFVLLSHNFCQKEMWDNKVDIRWKTFQWNGKHDLHAESQDLIPGTTAQFSDNLKEWSPSTESEGLLNTTSAGNKNQQIKF